MASEPIVLACTCIFVYTICTDDIYRKKQFVTRRAAQTAIALHRGKADFSDKALLSRLVRIVNAASNLHAPRILLRTRKRARNFATATGDRRRVRN